MTKGKIEIDSLIKLFASNLPVKELVGMDVSYIPGSELKLTGIKDYKGNPLQDYMSYPLDVPIEKYFNHEHNLRLAFLKNGLQGIYTYLEPFIGKDNLNALKDSFMKARKNNLINA